MKIEGKTIIVTGGASVILTVLVLHALAAGFLWAPVVTLGALPLALDLFASRRRRQARIS